MAWCRFVLLAISGPIRSMLPSWLLCSFFEGFDKDSACALDVATRGSFLLKSLAESREFLENIDEYSTFTSRHKPLQEEHKLSQEDFLAAESNPSSFTPLDSALEPSSEPGTSEEEEIQPPMFLSRFADDPTRTHKNTSNPFNAQSWEEPSSVHADRSQNSLTEPLLRPTAPPSPPNSCNKALPEEVMKEDWSDGEKCFSEAIWISSPSTITPCLIRGTTVESHINPIMEVNVLPWHLAYTLLSNVTLGPSDTLL